MALQVKLLTRTAKLPVKAHDTDAGFDLFYDGPHRYFFSNVMRQELLSTGIALAIPDGYYGRVAPRSSMACKGFLVGAGVIDSAYRGEVKVLLYHTGATPAVIHPGDKIAQLIITPIAPIHQTVQVDDLSQTDRGVGGFGSSGV